MKYEVDYRIRATIEAESLEKACEILMQRSQMIPSDEQIVNFELGDEPILYVCEKGGKELTSEFKEIMANLEW